MFNEAMVKKLHEMHLTAKADPFRTQMKDPAFSELPFEERLGLLIDIEWSRRKSNRLAKLIKNADFNFPGALIEDIEYHSDRKLDKAQITKLSSCSYIGEWLLVPLQGSELRDLLEIVEARHKKGSTIFSLQFAPAGWH